MQKVDFLQGIEGDVMWLRDELNRMHFFLKDAAQEQANNERICNWTSETRKVVQDVEDAIEMFVFNVENEMEGRIPCIPSPNHLYHLYRVGKEIESMRKRLKDIDESHERCGIQNLRGEGTSGSLSRRSSEDAEQRHQLSPLQKRQHLVSLDEDVNTLLQQLIVENKEGLSIAAIVGMSGTGKSTLAQKIYKYPAIAVEFECHAWVVVSSVFTPEEMIKQVIMELQNSEEQRRKVRKVTKGLEESTKDKLYIQQKLLEMLCVQLEGSIS